MEIFDKQGGGMYSSNNDIPVTALCGPSDFSFVHIAPNSDVNGVITSYVVTATLGVDTP